MHLIPIQCTLKDRKVNITQVRLSSGCVERNAALSAIGHTSSQRDTSSPRRPAVPKVGSADPSSKAIRGYISARAALNLLISLITEIMFC